MPFISVRGALLLVISKQGVVVVLSHTWPAPAKRVGRNSETSGRATTKGNAAFIMSVTIVQAGHVPTNEPTNNNGTLHGLALSRGYHSAWLLRSWTEWYSRRTDPFLFFRRIVSPTRFHQEPPGRCPAKEGPTPMASQAYGPGIESPHPSGQHPLRGLFFTRV